MLMDTIHLEVDLIQLLVHLAIMHNHKHCTINFMGLTIIRMVFPLQPGLTQPQVTYPEVSIMSMDIQFKDLEDNTNKSYPRTSIR